MKSKYNRLNKKLEILKNLSNNDNLFNDESHVFNERIINMSNVKFSISEN